MRLGRMATAKGLRSLSRLRGRVGVGVVPRFTLFVWREFPPPASHHSMRCATSPASGRGAASPRTGRFNQNHPALASAKVSAGHALTWGDKSRTHGTDRLVIRGGA